MTADLVFAALAGAGVIWGFQERKRRIDALTRIKPMSFAEFVEDERKRVPELEAVRQELLAKYGSREVKR